MFKYKKFSLNKGSKLKVLLLGYSYIAKKKIINTFIKHKISFCVASKSKKKNIVGSYTQYKSYNEGLVKSSADIVYISLPNSLHYKWAKKALNYNYHVIIDKPMCDTMIKTNKLINLAKKKNKFLSESVFFSHHCQILNAIKIAGGIKKINHIDVNFVIPKPNKKSILLSKKLKGGAIMDMGPYAASIARIFCPKKIKSKKIVLKKNNFNLITSFNILYDYSSIIYSGFFKIGGEYQNDLTLRTDKKIIKLYRVFAPPADQNLRIDVKENNKKKSYLIKQDNSFANYFFEALKIIKKKKYSYYFKQIKTDYLFREELLKKIG